MEPELTGGTIATIACVPLLLLLLGAGFVVLRKVAAWRDQVAEGKDRGRSYDDGNWERSEAKWARRAAWAMPVFAVATVALTWWGMFPWKSEYHHWTPITGVVDTADSRLVASGDKAMEDKFVVKFVGGDAQYGVLDTRAAGLKADDKLTITCVRIYQWAGTHGYDCNFVSLERAR
jgi:hypothetical protein